MKKVAVLLATYNGEKFLEEQINSLINQTYTNFDIIIRDDGSIDQTLKIIEKYEKKYPKKIINITDNIPSKKAQKNFFLLLKYAFDSKKYDYYMFCDQDDVWLEDKIYLEINKLKSIKGAGLVFTDLMVVNEYKETISNSFMTYSKLPNRSLSINELLIQNNMPGCTMAFNDDLVKHINLESINLMHDWHIAIVAALFGKTLFIDKPTILYRQHNNNTLGATKYSILKKFNDFKLYQQNINECVRDLNKFYNDYQKKITKEYSKMFNDFANIKKSNKFKRVLILYKYKIWKIGFFRKVFEIIYI